jgi:hypothetical protein
MIDHAEQHMARFDKDAEDVAQNIFLALLERALVEPPRAVCAVPSICSVLGARMVRLGLIAGDTQPKKSRGQNPVLGLKWAGEVERPASVLDRPTVPVSRTARSRVEAHGPWSSSRRSPDGDRKRPRATFRFGRSSCKGLPQGAVPERLSPLVHHEFVEMLEGKLRQAPASDSAVAWLLGLVAVRAGRRH